MTQVRVRRLVEDDDRSAFASGDPDLDRFFRRYAGQNQFRHHVGTSYVAVLEDRILGFVTVAPSSIEIEDLPKRDRRGLPAYPLPVLRLARLAVDQDAQGIGVGKLLLRTALELALEMATRLGCVGVVVDAKQDAVPWYARYGFESFDMVEGASGIRPRPTPMFLPLGKIPRRSR